MARLNSKAIPTAILLLGVALRIYVALIHFDQFHPDEHFQTLEPAGKIVYGFGWLSWEWTMGLRSWFVPALYVPLLFVLKLFGIVGGPKAVYACRVFQALASGALLWGFDRLLVRAGFRDWVRLGALGVLAFTPPMVAWGPATLSDNWAMVLLWASMPFFLSWLFEDSPKKWFLAGLLLGVTFLIRIQMVLWAGGIGIVLLFALHGTTRWKTCLYFTLGYLGAVFAQGLLDWLTWGEFLHSFITNIDMNFFQNAGATYGVSPWYEYFTLLTQNPGTFWILSLILLFVASACLGCLRARLGDALVLVPAVVFLLGHMIIPHKEVRFLLPMFPAIVYACALLGDSLAERLAVFNTDVNVVRALKLGGGVGLLLLAFQSVVFARNPAQYNFSNMSELIETIREDGALARHPESCLLLVDHYWVWSHGEFYQSHPVRWVEEASNAVTDRSLEECDYAITSGGAAPGFLYRTQGKWHQIGRNKWSYALFKRDGAS